MPRNSTNMYNNYSHHQFHRMTLRPELVSRQYVAVQFYANSPENDQTAVSTFVPLWTTTSHSVVCRLTRHWGNLCLVCQSRDWQINGLGDRTFEHQLSPRDISNDFELVERVHCWCHNLHENNKYADNDMQCKIQWYTETQPFREVNKKRIETKSDITVG